MSEEKVLNIALAVMTYNEAGNIPKLLRDTEKAVKNIKNVKFTMFVVDDSSPDGTGKVVKKEAKKITASNLNVTLLTKNKKEGLGGAYIWGCQKIMQDERFDYICEMDADLSHNPKYLKDFVRHAQNGAEVVVGSRYVKGGSIPDWSLKRKIMSVLGNLYVRFWLGSKFTDWSGGFNMYSVELLKKLDLNTLPKSYTFILTLKNRAQKITNKTVEVPIVFMDRTIGESKIPSSYMKEVILTCPKLTVLNLKKKITKQSAKATLPYVAIYVALTSMTATCLVHFSTLFSPASPDKSWRHYLLADGDSLVIPLLFKSVFEQREIFGWISSSQLFLFPEGILYGISYVMTLSFSNPFVASLYMCGALILLTVFTLLYFIFKQVTDGSRMKSYLYALLILAFITGTMLLEPYYNGGTSLSSFLMMSSYYPGSIICILIVILATLGIIKSSPDKLNNFLHNKKLILLSVLVIFIESAAIVCNALCLLYIVMPMVVTILFAFIVNAIKRTPALILLGIQFVSVALYFAIRHFFTSDYLTNDFSFSINSISDAVNFYINGVWNEINNDIFSKVEWSLFALFFITSIIISAIALYKITHNRDGVSDKYRTVMWISFYAWITIVGIIASNLAGRYATRYFLPLIILPPLSVAVYLATINKRLVTRICSAALVILVFIFISVTAYSILKFNNGSLTSLDESDDSIACSLEFINKHEGNVASNSWFYVRALDLYDDDQRALPFGGDGTPWYWINNKYSYKDMQYSIFAVEPESAHSDPSNEKLLFNNMTGYEDVTECSGDNVKLYYYKKGTADYNRLNDVIRKKTNERFGWS